MPAYQRAWQAILKPSLTAIDDVITRSTQQGRLVGCVVVVGQSGKVIFRRAAGFSDLDNLSPMSVDTVFRLASVTKPFITTLSLILADKGVVFLHEPVRQWLPDFRSRLPDGSRPDLTLHHLLTHTSGLSYRFLEPRDSLYHTFHVSDGMDQAGLTLTENLKRLGQTFLSFAPGTGWRYSLGLDVAGAVLEVSSGVSLQALFRRYMADTLRLRHTGFPIIGSAAPAPAPVYEDTSGNVRKMRAYAELPLDAGLIRLSPDRHLNPDSYASGGAGMLGTADEVFRFLEALRMCRSETGFGANLSSIYQLHVSPDAQTQGPGWGFGYGAAVLCDPQAAGTPQNAGTIQWGGVYGHAWFIDPALDLTVVSLSNTTLEGMSGSYVRDLRDAVYQSIT